MQEDQAGGDDRREQSGGNQNRAPQQDAYPCRQAGNGWKLKMPTNRKTSLGGHAFRSTISGPPCLRHVPCELPRRGRVNSRSKNQAPLAWSGPGLVILPLTDAPSADPHCNPPTSNHLSRSESNEQWSVARMTLRVCRETAPPGSAGGGSQHSSGGQNLLMRWMRRSEELS